MARVKPRIAVVEQTSELGGAQINHLLLQRHRPGGYEVIPILPGPGPLAAELEAAGSRPVILPMPRLLRTGMRLGRDWVSNPLAMAWNAARLLAASGELAALLRDRRIDIVATNGMLAHFYGAFAARRAGLPCVWQFHDIIISRFPLDLVRRAFTAAAGALPQALVVPSRAVLEALRPPAKLAAKTYVVPNGVDTREFAPRPAPAGLRTSLGLREDDFVVGMFGRITRWKGHEDLLRAARRVKEAGGKAKFLLVGGDSLGEPGYARDLRELASALGLEDSVRFAGFRGDVADCMAAVDVCAAPSAWPEPFGRVLIEAMAMGKPCICASHGASAEIIEHGRDGLLIAPRDPEALADAVLTLLRDPSAVRRMGAAARAAAVARFSIRPFLLGNCRVLRRVLPRQIPGECPHP